MKDPETEIAIDS